MKTAKLTVRIPEGAFNKAYLPLLDCRERYIVLYGGAGSGKSFFAAQRTVYKLLRQTRCNVLVVRACAATHRNSTFALLRRVIAGWKLDRYFKIYEGELRIRCLLGGNEIVFRGLDDAEKLKSITFARGDLTDIWVEEASEIKEADFHQLDLRLRGRGEKKQLLLSFNPVSVNHWLKRRFFDGAPSGAAVLHTTYRDNAFLSPEDAALLESFRERDPYYYAVYCLGEWGVMGQSVFGAARVQRRLQAARAGKPLRRGQFTYTYNGRWIEENSIAWQEDPEGAVCVYALPEKGRPYVIGGDTAGDGSDFFVGQVLDNITGRQAAVLRHRLDEDLYARQMFCLGRYYNEALIGIEVNCSTFPVKELARLGYTRQYLRENEDTVTGGVQLRYGFRTTAVTRPLILSGLVQAFREHDEMVCDAQTLEEMLAFVRNERGRPEAMRGAHDDCVMALAIAVYIRGQQEARCAGQASKRTVWSQDMLEDYAHCEEDAQRRYLLQKWGDPF